MTQQKQIDGDFEPFFPAPATESPDAGGAALASEPIHFAQQVVDAVRKPLLVLGNGMRVQTANRSFYHVFQLSRADVEQRCVYDLDVGQSDIPRLRKLLGHVWTQETPPEDVELEREFP